MITFLSSIPLSNLSYLFDITWQQYHHTFIAQLQFQLFNCLSHMARFDWVPYLEGKYLSYYQWFAAIGSFVCLLLSFLSFFIYLLLSKIKSHQKIVVQNQQDKFLKPNPIQKWKNIFFNVGFIWLSIIPLICSALDVIYLIQGSIGMIAIYTVQIYLDNGRKLWINNQYQPPEDIRKKNSASIIQKFVNLSLRLSPKAKKMFKYAIVASVIAPLFMYKTCLCFYNAEIGYYNDTLGFGINTYFTRLFQLKVSCPQGAPCQMYATVPQNPSQAFFLNIHTHKDVEQVVVFYQELHTSDVTQFKNVTAETIKYQGLEWKAARNVHSALIVGLKPNTKYLTKIFYNNRFWTNAVYKTLPSDPSTPIRMINAGDSGYTQASINLTKIVATLKPDIFFMGGDIAYDDNMPACAYTWDFFLGMYGRFTQTVGYLVPIVATVGNHDVGLNQLPGVNITVNDHGPAYFIYFPQHYDRNLDGHILQKVPPLNHRRTILNFTFSNVHYLALDSGYMHLFDGYQKSFMIDSFEANKDKFKFVNYHVPVYSVCQGFDKSPQRFLYALFHWIPNFDKYKVMTVFENHVHAFKRTKPLVGSYPKQNGTVYVGDGAYGAIISQMCNPDASLNIFDAFSKKNNVWLSQITSNKVQHWAYDSQGNVMDYFVQYAQGYKLTQQQINQKEKAITVQQVQQIMKDHYKRPIRQGDY